MKFQIIAALFLVVATTFINCAELSCYDSDAKGSKSCKPATGADAAVAYDKTTHRCLTTVGSTTTRKCGLIADCKAGSEESITCCSSNDCNAPPKANSSSNLKQGISIIMMALLAFIIF